MNAFSSLKMMEQGIFLQFQFLVVFYAAFHIGVLFYERRWMSFWRVFLVPTFFLTDGCILLSCFHGFRMKRLQVALPNTLHGYEMPVYLLNMIFFGTFLYFICLSGADRRYRKDSITRNSIKNAMDSLPSGICLAEENGLLLLANLQMQRLSERLTGEELQDAEAFWRYIRENGTNAEADYAEMQLEDQSCWAFQRRHYSPEQRNVCKITAVDLTAQKQIYDQLQEKNRQLSLQIERFRRYSRDVDRVTREKERLLYKSRIHKEMGELLLGTKYFMEKGSAEEAGREILSRWKMELKALRSAARPQGEKSMDDWEMLRKTADLVGLKVVVDGELPTDKTAHELLLAAAAEAMTNAVKHAEAEVITLQVEQRDGVCLAQFTNDGLVPTEKIHLGGGLQSLQNRLEECGGSLSVEQEPVYRLNIRIPAAVQQSGL